MSSGPVGTLAKPETIMSNKEAAENRRPSDHSLTDVEHGHQGGDSHCAKYEGDKQWRAADPSARSARLRCPEQMTAAANQSSGRDRPETTLVAA